LKARSPSRKKKKRELKGSTVWPEVSQLDAHRLLEGYKERRWSATVTLFVESLLGRYAKRIRERSVRFHRKKEREEQ
jgi:hypothetical protein